MEELRIKMERVQMAKKLDQAKAKLNVIKQVEAEVGDNFDIDVGPSLPGDGMNEYIENYPAGTVRTMYVHCTYIVPTVRTMYVHCTYSARWVHTDPEL